MTLYPIDKFLLWVIGVIAFEVIVVIVGRLTGSEWCSRNFITGAAFRITLVLQGVFAMMLCWHLIGNVK